MQTDDIYIITIDKHGRLTLPRELRDNAGMAGDYLVTAEITDEGILLRPVNRYST